MFRLALLAVVALAAPAFAAPPAPAVEVRLKSVNELLGYFEYIGETVNQAEQAKQAVGFVKALSGEKGIAGVDPAAPFGLYAVITPNVVDSKVVLMVPIKSEDAFLDLLRGQLSLDPKKGDDGVYELDVPNVPPTVYFRFANGYAYATVKEKASIAVADLIDPKTYFSKQEPAVLTAAIHVERVPADVRKTLFGQIELQMAQEKEKKNPGDTPGQHKLKGIMIDSLTSAVFAAGTDAKSITARLHVRPAADEIAFDLTTIPQAGTDTSKALMAVGSRKAIAPAAAVATNPVVAVSSNGGLPTALIEKLGPIIDQIIQEAIENANGVEKVAAQKILDAIAPTLKAGQAEFGLAMTGPDDAGKYRLQAALRTTKGSEIEKTAKEFSPFLPADKVKVTFDKEKVGSATLHAFALADGEVNNMFPGGRGWLLTSDDLVGLSFDPEPADLKKIAAAQPAAADLFKLELSAAAAAFAFERGLPKEKLKELVNDAFDRQSPTGKDGLTLTVRGGETLTVTATTKGKAVKLLAALDQARKDNAK